MPHIADGPILVTGASGKTGSLCARKLIDAGAHVRTFVRRPEAAAALRDMGARECVVGDLFDKEALGRAVAGAEQILHICPPTDPRETELAAVVTDLASRHGVRRLVLYSVLHPTADVPHHRRKLEAETYLKNSGLVYTIMQPCRYMTHLLPIWPEVLREGVHRMPFSIDSRFSLVALDDLAEAARVILMNKGHEYATYELAGPERLSQMDCAAIISEVLGRPVRAERKNPDVFLGQMIAAGMPRQRIDVMLAMNHHYDAHGLIGNGNILRWLLGRELRVFRDFVAELAAKQS